MCTKEWKTKNRTKETRFVKDFFEQQKKFQEQRKQNKPCLQTTIIEVTSTKGRQEIKGKLTLWICYGIKHNNKDNYKQNKTKNKKQKKNISWKLWGKKRTKQNKNTKIL